MLWRKKKPEMFIPPELQAYYQPQSTATLKQPVKKKLLIAIIALVAVITLGVGIGLLLSNHKSDPYTNTSAPASQQAPETTNKPVAPDTTKANTTPVAQP